MRDSSSWDNVWLRRSAFPGWPDGPTQVSQPGKADLLIPLEDAQDVREVVRPDGRAGLDLHFVPAAAGQGRTDIFLSLRHQDPLARIWFQQRLRVRPG